MDFEKHLAGLFSNPILICGSPYHLSIFCFMVPDDTNDWFRTKAFGYRWRLLLEPRAKNLRSYKYFRLSWATIQDCPIVAAAVSY